MSYLKALEATGNKVMAYKEYGSYQGTWIAKLEDGNYILANYGSCSGCDDYHNEFDWEEDESSEEFKAKLASFGNSYINLSQSKENLIKEINNNYAYYSDNKDEILKDLTEGDLR